MTPIPDTWRDRTRTPIDFIVVGAGAGGAPLAARLVERGYTVLVIEMGPRQPDKPPGAQVEPTEVPLLHPSTTEDERHSLRFFVKHFDHDPEESRDWKVHRPRNARRDEAGIFYPRAQGVGGCTIHNAMITISGPPEDWDEIAEATGDESWRGERMRRYFQRVERCHYARPSFWARAKALFGFGTGWENSRHGSNGWLDVTFSNLLFLKRDRTLLKVVLGGVAGAVRSGAEGFGDLLRAAVFGRLRPELDPNHWETLRRSPEGAARIPVAITPNGERSSPRERLLGLLDTNAPHRGRLLLQSGTCVTGLILVKDPAQQPRPRAVGIHCLPQEHVYEADPNASVSEQFPGAEQVPIYCRRDVLLCGGTFNTPQLLMLSGVGPAEHLRALGIDVLVDLPGVGANLQDRYEVPVHATVTDRFRSLDGLTLSATQPDPELRKWIDHPKAKAVRRGIYATNGGLVGLFVRSAQEERVPDLFIFALAGSFPGYYVGYSAPEVQLGRREGDPPGHRRALTWLILKARTRHREGTVRLRCRNPLRRPEIHFRSFPAGADEAPDPDLEALHEGVQVVERILRIGREQGTIAAYEYPGFDAFDGDVRAWIRHTAWGHHACGTCRIGADGDPRAVLDSRFRVRGVSGLRVVDASVFPRIPGFFIVSNIYTIAEKAADAIAEDHPLVPGRLPPDARAALEREPIYPSRPEHQARRAYPAALEEAEAELVRQRRQAAGLSEQPDPGTPS